MDRELWVQRLSPEHEAKLAELQAPVGVTEQRAYESTVVGEFRRREGITERIDHQGAEQLVAEVKSEYRSRYGRELKPAEEAALRKQAELRSVLVTGGRDASSSWALAERHRWGVVKEPGQGSGVATRLNGRWTDDSDPAVAAATEAAEEEHAARAAAAEDAWANGPLVMRTVGRPT
jgi:hypothetical protein